MLASRALVELQQEVRVGGLPLDLPHGVLEVADPVAHRAPAEVADDRVEAAHVGQQRGHVRRHVVEDLAVPLHHRVEVDVKALGQVVRVPTHPCVKHGQGTPDQPAMRHNPRVLSPEILVVEHLVVHDGLALVVDPEVVGP